MKIKLFNKHGRFLTELPLTELSLKSNSYPKVIIWQERAFVILSESENFYNYNEVSCLIFKL